MIQEFTIRFNKIYNSIPDNMKPPPDLELQNYLDVFYPDIAYQLRERDLATLEEMKNNAVSVEANLMIKKSQLKHEKPEKNVTIKEEPSTSSSDAKLYSLTRAMEKMMERLTITDRNPPRENQVSPQIRNLNFRRNPPQIRQRDPRYQREQRGPDQ